MTKRVPAVVAVLGVLAAALCACRTQDIQTITISVTEVKNEKCEEIVRAALKATEGVQGDSIRFRSGTVTVTYDSMKTARMNIVFAIAKTGFSADDTPADPAARSALPEECR